MNEIKKKEILTETWNIFLVLQMRLPSKPYSSLPIYSIGSSNTLPRERINAMAAVGLSVAGGQGTSADGGPTAPPAAKKATTRASKRAAKISGAEAAAEAGAKCERSSTSPHRHSNHKTMTK